MLPFGMFPAAFEEPEKTKIVSMVAGQPVLAGWQLFALSAETQNTPNTKVTYEACRYHITVETWMVTVYSKHKLPQTLQRTLILFGKDL